MPAASSRPARPNGSSYTVEFHRKAGWDRSIPRDAVTVHEVRSNTFSYLPSTGHNLGVNEQYVTPDPKLWIRVTAIDPATETATEYLGSMEGGVQAAERAVTEVLG